MPFFGLEKVLDTLAEEEFAVFHVSGVARMEEAVLVESLSIDVVSMIIARCDGRAFEQNFIIVTNLDFQAANGTAH